MFLSCMSSLYILNPGPLSDMSLQIFSPVLEIVFLTVLIMSSDVFNFGEGQLLFFAFVSCAFGVISKTSLLSPESKRQNLKYLHATVIIINKNY